MLEIVVGHRTLAALLRRDSTAVFSGTYRYIENCLPPLRWSVAQRATSCAGFTGLLIGLVSRWLGNWDQEVIATDASSQGWRIAAATWPLDEVQKCGRIRERWPFLEADAVDARRHSLSQAGIDVTSLPLLRASLLVPESGLRGSSDEASRQPYVGASGAGAGADIWKPLRY